MPYAARADVITGILNTTGTAQISQGSISFVNNLMTVNGPASAQNGGWVALAGTTATIANITNPPDAVGPVNHPNFITFLAAPNISFTFTFLLPGIDGTAGCTANPPAAGQVCTPSLPNPSPYNLQNTSATSSSASFRILGTEIDSLTGQTVPITGTFTTPFTSQNFQQILATIAAGGTITTSFSAQFSTGTVNVVPEPGTWTESMIALFLIGIGVAGSRSRAGRHTESQN